MDRLTVLKRYPEYVRGETNRAKNEIQEIVAHLYWVSRELKKNQEDEISL